MKIVRVSGGLGNQIFQYAFARSLEERTGDRTFLDLSTYGYEATHNGFELGRLFAVRCASAEEKDIQRLGTRPMGVFSKLRRKYFSKPTHYIDSVFHYDPAVFSLDGDRYFEGWWQSEKYFSSIADVIRKELRFIADPGKKNEQLLDGIEAMSMCTPVSLHVRRGDALENPDTWVCTDAYYRNAIQRARGSIVAPHFLVFSDDISWCRGNLPIAPEEATFVDWNSGEDSWRDMWLMSRCSVHIIANSTFSWWGAWLNPSPDKLVLAPERWSLARPRPFAYYRYAFDEVVPESWIRIPVE